MTLARLLSTPTSTRAILWGKVSGTFAIGLFQLTSLIVLTSVIYRVDWGSSLSGLVGLTITTVFAATGLAVFVAALARTARTADLLSLIIVQISSLAGGSMFPLQAMPDFMKTVAKATVNGWAITGYTNLMGGGGLESILQPTLALTVMGFVLVAIGAWRLSLE
jgi:ABC-2 type transport system permease protein